MILAIIGGRDFTDYEKAEQEILQKYDISEISGIVSGGADGADSIAEVFAYNHKIPMTIHRPDWKIGRHAGMLRNTKIIDECDQVIAFWDGKSRGTEDSIKKAQKAGKEVYVVLYNNNKKSLF